LRIPVAADVSLEARQWPGDAPGFLLVHGLASNARMWDGVAELLARAGHRAVAVDQRGHGQSDKPDDGYDFGTLTADLVALTDALDLNPVVAVGQSWGANVVLDYACRAPERVRGVACVDGGTIDMSRRFPDWDEAAVTLAPPNLAGTPLAQIEAYMRGAHADWPETGIQGALANFDVFDDGTVAPWLTRERHMLILRELWEHRPSEVRAGVDALDIPVLVISAREIGADHDVHAQKPELVARKLLETFT
jgi:pimeloyl-ACP methyl ester carboxylesterase